MYKKYNQIQITNNFKKSFNYKCTFISIVGILLVFLYLIITN